VSLQFPVLPGVGCVSETNGWYSEKRIRKRGRVAAALPIMIPSPGSTEDMIASSAVASR
jgi:hypothetical protein